jgi:CBS domain-containing protein
MTAEDIMVRKLVTAPPSASLLSVTELMARHGVSRVIISVRKNGRGIITEKDIIRFLSGDRTRKTLEGIRASTIMNGPLIAVKGNKMVQEIATQMLSKGISSVVVLDEKSRLLGIVTKTDLCHYYAGGFSRRHRVKEFMTNEVVTVRPSHSIFHAADLMNERKVSRLIVVDKGLEGVVTMSDLISVSALFRPKRLLTRHKYVFGKGFIVPARSIPLITVMDVMTTKPVSVQEDDDLADAASQMATHRVSGLPVLNKSGRITGVVSRTDVTRAIASL